MTAKPSIQVRVGQVWADNDKRVKPERLLRITRVGQGLNCAYASAVVVSGRNNGRRVQVLMSRFRPTATGYRLVKEAEGRRKA